MYAKSSVWPYWISYCSKFLNFSSGVFIDEMLNRHFDIFVFHFVKVCIVNNIVYYQKAEHIQLF